MPVPALSCRFFLPLLILSPSSSFKCWLNIGLKVSTYFSVCVFLLAVYTCTLPGSLTAPFSTALFLLPHISVSLLYFTVGVTNILYNLQNVSIPGHYFNTAPVNFSTFRCTMNVI